MTEHRLRMVVIAEVCGAVFVALFILVDFLESTNRIGANIGAPILVAVLLVMIVIGVTALIRTRPKK